jgi:hypothetical protein
VVVLPQPRLLHKQSKQIRYLDGMGETTCNDTVPCNLTHITTTQFPYLSCHRVLLYQGFLGKMKLKRVISAEGDEETTLEVFGKGIPVVGEKEGIVG